MQRMRLRPSRCSVVTPWRWGSTLSPLAAQQMQMWNFGLVRYDVGLSKVTRNKLSVEIALLYMAKA